MKISPQKSKFSTVLMVIIILAIGAASAGLFIATKPDTKRVKPPKSSPLVSVLTAKRHTAQLTVEALGTVKADQETIVRVRVAGQVEELGKNFDVGGLLQKDDLLLRIDASDYENALAMKQSALAKAEADYSLEMGQQRVARTELAQLNKTAPNTVRNTALALREPQLAQAKATLQAAEVEVKQAELDLSRTKVTAPFNAIVINRNVSLGSQASLSDNVATIASTDIYYVEAAIPLDKLKGLGLGVFDNTPAKIFTTTGTVREGQVRHSVATLDTTTRMGRVLIEVHDPLALQSSLPELILGDHVRVELQAGFLENVVELPREALRGNNQIWVAKKGINNELTLDIRTVEVLWKDANVVLISTGIETGDMVVSSTLGAPIQDMSLRLSAGKGPKAGMNSNAGQDSKPVKAEPKPQKNAAE